MSMLRFDAVQILADAAEARRQAMAAMPSRVACFLRAGDGAADAEARAEEELPDLPERAVETAFRAWMSGIDAYARDGVLAEGHAAKTEIRRTAWDRRAAALQPFAAAAKVCEKLMGVIGAMSDSDVASAEAALAVSRAAAAAGRAQRTASAAAEEATKTPEQRTAEEAARAAIRYENESRRIAGYYTPY